MLNAPAVIRTILEPMYDISSPGGISSGTSEKGSSRLWMWFLYSCSPGLISLLFSSTFGVYMDGLELCRAFTALYYIHQLWHWNCNVDLRKELGKYMVKDPVSKWIWNFCAWRERILFRDSSILLANDMQTPMEFISTHVTMPELG
jgi:hypothetical protein